MEKKYYYKAMSKDMKCEEFQFEIGETYTIESKDLRLCSGKVFNFCEKLEDTISYYYNPTNRHFLIEVLGDIVTEDNKLCSHKIRIVKEISREEIEEHIQDKSSYNAKKLLALYTSNVRLIEELSKVEDWEVLCAVAKNINTPEYILEELSKNEYEFVRRAVAKNPNTPKHILEKLAKDEDLLVREAVAENPNTPIHILEELVKDKSWVVRFAVVKNSNTTIDMLEELVKDKSWVVRFAVAKNSNTTIDVLEKLSKDLHENVRNKAQERLREIAQ